MTAQAAHADSPQRPTLVGVTGATGAIGGQVARTLAASGVPQRLLVRRPAAAPTLPGATAAACNYADRAGAVQAMQGVDTLLLVSAHESADRLDQHQVMVRAARDAGVRHVVYTSYVNAAPDAVFTLARDHWATEQMLRDSGMEFTFLRDNMYLDFAAELAGRDGVIRGPAGAGRVAMVARADIAGVASQVLHHPAEHVGATYDMTGPEALSLPAVAELLSRASGRPITFHDESVEEAHASRAHYGAPDWQVEAWVSTYTAIAAGQLAHVSGDVERVTGRPPVSLAQFLGLAWSGHPGTRIGRC